MFNQFAFGVAFGIVPCLVWGKLGGDEGFEKKHPELRKLLKFVHHWWIGLIIMGCSLYFRNVATLGFGLGTYLDDALFHSFESYFKRLNNKDYNET